MIKHQSSSLVYLAGRKLHLPLFLKGKKQMRVPHEISPRCLGSRGAVYNDDVHAAVHDRVV